MPRLPHVDATTRSTSFSHRLGARFADSWRAEAEVDRLVAVLAPTAA